MRSFARRLRMGVLALVLLLAVATGAAPAVDADLPAPGDGPEEPTDPDADASEASAEDDTFDDARIEQQAETALQLLRQFTGSLLVLGGLLVALERLVVAAVSTGRGQRSAGTGRLDRSSAIRTSAGLLACALGAALFLGGTPAWVAAGAMLAGAVVFAVYVGRTWWRDW